MEKIFFQVETKKYCYWKCLKYGFYKKLLQYKWTSDQLNTFFLTFWPAFWCVHQTGQKVRKKVFNWSDVHLYRSYFLQNPYFNRPRPQIELHPNSWQYPWINYLVLKDDSDIPWVHCGGTGLVLPELEFVKEWVMKSSKVLFTFADISHRSCYYVFHKQILKIIPKFPIFDP